MELAKSRFVLAIIVGFKLRRNGEHGEVQLLGKFGKTEERARFIRLMC